MKIYEFKDYKKLLKFQTAKERGMTSQLAREAGCAQSYMSQVIHGKPELTPDQALAVAVFLGFGSEETEYFLNLVQFSRAATPKLREYHARKLEILREQNLRVESAVSKTNNAELELLDRSKYYESWIMPAIHILTACPEFQTPKAIANRLSIPIKEVEQALGWLVQVDLVEKKQTRYIHSGKNIHLPTHSAHNHLNHLNWRMRGLHSALDVSSVHYTSVFALGQEDWEKIRAKLLEFISEQRAQIGASPSEDAFVFCCDLFRA